MAQMQGSLNAGSLNAGSLAGVCTTPDVSATSGPSSGIINGSSETTSETTSETMGPSRDVRQRLAQIKAEFTPIYMVQVTDRIRVSLRLIY